MKKILISALTIMAIAIPATSATYAYFSSRAQVLGNTVAAGTLEVRVNGQPTIAGAQVTALAPGREYTFTHNINNYGQPSFSGQSNLSAKKMLLSIANPNDFGSGLWDQVYVKVETNAGWSTWQQNYWGKLKDLGNRELLAPRWTELAPGNSIDVKYTFWLPESGTDQSSLMGKNLNWDFVIEGRTN